MPCVCRLYDSQRYIFSGQSTLSALVRRANSCGSIVGFGVGLLLSSLITRRSLHYRSLLVTVCQAASPPACFSANSWAH